MREGIRSVAAARDRLERRRGHVLLEDREVRQVQRHAPLVVRDSPGRRVMPALGRLAHRPLRRLERLRQELHSPFPLEHLHRNASAKPPRAIIREDASDPDHRRGRLTAPTGRPRRATVVMHAGTVRVSAEEVDLRIRVGGLQPRQRVTVRARAENWNWEAWGTFVADGLGRVDPPRQAPLEGTYRGVEPMGLFWSMVETTPGLGALGNAFALSAEADGRPVAERAIFRAPRDSAVAARSLLEGDLAGQFFVPPVVRGPPVLVLSGSGGGVDAFSAGLLASHGFPALSLAHFTQGAPRGLTGAGSGDVPVSRPPVMGEDLAGLPPHLLVGVVVHPLQGAHDVGLARPRGTVR
jgi:hypothetical protein